MSAIVVARQKLTWASNTDVYRFLSVLGVSSGDMDRQRPRQRTRRSRIGQPTFVANPVTLTPQQEPSRSKAEEARKQGSKH
jgi:hypothetical protein